MANIFKSGFSLGSPSTILQRCQKDDATRARLKYSPWYYHFEGQQGVKVRLDGREMLMMSSNDYLGMSFHPKVIEASQKARGA